MSFTFIQIKKFFTFRSFHIENVRLNSIQLKYILKFNLIKSAFHEFDRNVRMQHDTKVKKFKIEAEHGDMDSLRDLLRPTLANLAIPYEYATIYEYGHIGTVERYNIRLKHTIES